MDYKKILADERKLAREKLLASCNVEVPENVVCNEVEEKTVKTESKSIADEFDGSGCSTIQLNLDSYTNLEGCQIGNVPVLYYATEVISVEDEFHLVSMIDKAGQIDTERWKQLRNRRLQCWGKFPLSADRMSEELVDDLEEYVPSWLEGMIAQLVQKGIFEDKYRPNNILINQYKASEGILHHTDGPTYYDKVVIISLNSDCLMTFRRNLSPSEIGQKYSGDVFSVLLKRRSMLIFSKEVYSDYLHGIEIDKEVQIVGESCECVNKELTGVSNGDKILRGLRTSLTFRKLRFEGGGAHVL